MIRIAWFILGLMGLFFSETAAQTPGELWKSGRLLAGENQWDKVSALLKPHIFPPPEDGLAPALLQLYALASWRLGDYPSAMATLDKIEQNYAGWNGINETHYLAGEINWTKKQFTRAWSRGWSSLNDTAYLSRIQGLTQSFKVTDDTLTLWKANPGRISDNLLFRSWLNRQQTSPLPVKTSGLPKIGIVLPFQTKNTKPNAGNNPSLDYYRGMLLANEVCTASDSGLEFHVFDSKGVESEIQNHLSANAYKGLDALVGPFKSSLTQTLASGADKWKIPLFNALSNQGIQSRKSEYFCQQASFGTIAKECFQFISQHSTGSKVAIVFGPEKNDSLMADAYRQYVKKMGREISLFRKVGKNSAANLTKYLLEAGLDSTCHVFVPNNEPLVRVQMLSSYGWMKARYPILVYGKWLEASNPDFEEFARNPIFFADPDLPDHSSSHWKDWEASYIAKWGTPPNWISWKGFDLVRSLSRVWYGSANGFSPLFTSAQSLPSDLFGQYKLDPLFPDNQFVPIYKLEKEGILRVWPK